MTTSSALASRRTCHHRAPAKTKDDGAKPVSPPCAAIQAAVMPADHDWKEMPQRKTDSQTGGDCRRVEKRRSFTRPVRRDTSRATGQAPKKWLADAA